MNTIEKMARAIEQCRIDVRKDNDAERAKQGLWPCTHTQPSDEQYARSALNALLEPSEAMLTAGADNLFAAASDDWLDDARLIWSAMIQAALDEVAE